MDLRFHALASDVFFRGPPTWLRLPAVDRILWRLSQHNTLFQHWAVKEMRFYQGVDCTAAVPGEALGSGEVPAAPANPARNAFDGELSTEWWSRRPVGSVGAQRRPVLWMVVRVQVPTCFAVRPLPLALTLQAVFSFAATSRRSHLSGLDGLKRWGMRHKCRQEIPNIRKQ